MTLLILKLQLELDPKSFHLISIQSRVTALEVLLWRFYSLCCHKKQIKSLTVHFLDVLSQLYREGSQYILVKDERRGVSYRLQNQKRDDENFEKK